MQKRRDDLSLGYIKSRILYFIITHSGKYSADDLAEIFGFKKRRIQDFIKEFNHLGYNIYSKKGKYCIENPPEELVKILYELNYKDFKMATILEYLASYTNGINRRAFVDELQNNFNESKSVLQNMIRELIDDGFIQEKNGLIKIENNILSLFKKDEIDIMRFYLNVMKHFHYKGYVFENIIDKIDRITGYSQDYIKIYPDKKRIGLYDTYIINEIEQAIIEKKSVNIKYKFKNGVKRININPCAIAYLEEKDLAYVIENNDGYSLYRIDKIIEAECRDGQINEFNRDDFKNSIGISLEPCFETEVYFEKQPFIKDKLERYIKKRDSAKLVEKDDKYVLMDCVSGFKEFKTWVNSFGRSAYVVKPEKLKEEIMEEIKLTLERYN